MNILDLAYAYDLEIDPDGDFNRCIYHMKFTYMTSTNSSKGVTDIIEKVSLNQQDIDDIYSGALKLVKLLKAHTTEGY